MDWWRLFALLVAVASIHVSAEGPKKKIRIHLPQKVKHIHHHKKIYITNHPAHTQYAPAFLPNAEGAVAVPANVVVPAETSIVPLGSVELYEESQKRLPGVSAAASKLLPLYRARGYYGPNHSELDEQDYDLAPPPEPEDSHSPPAFSLPPIASAASSSYPSKRVKIVKINEIPPRKKVIRKVKPKRVVVRGRPQPEEEHPVSPFHEQFYSDLKGSGTIKKIKRPQRVEKIVDGDTEHIHTYSEEHIHKVVFDDGPKVSALLGVPRVHGAQGLHGPHGFHGAHGANGFHGVRALLGSDHMGSYSSLGATHSLIPIQNSQNLVAYPSEHFTGLTAVGSMGTPSHLEYAAYNPHDVTHDHIFHDHGEITSDIDITKASLGYPPKVSFNSQGLRISGSGPKRPKSKTVKRPKSKKPSASASNDFSYYESIYSPYAKPKKTFRTTTQSPRYETSSEEKIHDYEPIPSFKVKDKSKLKSRYIPPSPYYGSEDKPLSDYRLQEASVPAPFSLSSTVVHDYKPKNFAESAHGAEVSNFKDPFDEFKDSHSFEYDTYASSSNFQASQNQVTREKKDKNKSISTQNIHFGRLHATEIDHQEEPSGTGNEDETPSSAEINEAFEDSATSTPYTIKETSPAHQYYSNMAFKALHGDFGDQMSIPEASNNNFQYVEAPTSSTSTSTSSVATTTSAPLRFFRIQSTDAVTIQPTDIEPDTRQNKHNRERSRLKPFSTGTAESKPRQTVKQIQKHSSTNQDSDRSTVPHTLRHLSHRYVYDQSTDSPTVRGKLKYGDKI